MTEDPASSATYSFSRTQLQPVKLKSFDIYSILLFKAVQQDFLESNSFSNTGVNLRLNAAYAPNSEAIN